MAAVKSNDLQTRYQYFHLINFCYDFFEIPNEDVNGFNRVNFEKYYTIPKANYCRIVDRNFVFIF